MRIVSLALLSFVCLCAAGGAGGRRGGQHGLWEVLRRSGVEGEVRFRMEGVGGKQGVGGGGQI